MNQHRLLETLRPAIPKDELAERRKSRNIRTPHARYHWWFACGVNDLRILHTVPALCAPSCLQVRPGVTKALKRPTTKPRVRSERRIH